MLSKKEQITQMVDALFANNPPAFDNAVITSIKDFIEIAINGDTISKMHGIILSDDDIQKNTYAIFVLTDIRLIKIEISSDKKSSEEFFLDSIKIEWMFNKHDDVKISSGTTFFIVKNIDADDKAFFQAVGEARARHDGVSTNEQ